MTAINDTPTNLNYLSPLNFKFLIKKAPNVNFFIQKVNIPKLTLKSVIIPNQSVPVPYPGDHLDYGTLDITFKVDEKLQNYLEIHNWIRYLGKLDYNEYYNLEKNPTYTGDGIYSDINLSVLSNIKTINYDVVFIDAYPVELSSVTFNTTDNDVNYLEASASFKYTYYNIAQTV